MAVICILYLNKQTIAISERCKVRYRALHGTKEILLVGIQFTSLTVYLCNPIAVNRRVANICPLLVLQANGTLGTLTADCRTWRNWHADKVANLKTKKDINRGKTELIKWYRICCVICLWYSVMNFNIVIYLFIYLFIYHTVLTFVPL